VTHTSPPIAQFLRRVHGFALANKQTGKLFALANKQAGKLFVLSSEFKPTFCANRRQPACQNVKFARFTHLVGYCQLESSAHTTAQRYTYGHM
jgi:hypothetical protein